MLGQHCTQGRKGGPPEPELLWRRGSCRVLPEIARGDAKRPVDEDVARVSAKLPNYPGGGRSERFPVAGPGQAHGLPRTVLFVFACTNWTLVGAEAAFERRERVVSVAPHMPEMEAEVAAVTRHRSLTRLEAAEPRTAPSRRAPSLTFSRIDHSGIIRTIGEMPRQCTS